MIRPVTIATFLMACGSGLYLYQSKHEVQLLDRTIERTVRETAALREQSKLLVAEWTMLNDPERLRQLSDTYLSLRTIAPTQFTSLADLDNRLPAPRVEPPPTAPEPARTPVAAVPDSPGLAPATSEPAGPVVADQEETLPVPPRLAPPPSVPGSAVVAAVRPPPKPQAPKLVVTEVPPQRTLAAAEVKPVEHHAPEQRAVHAAEIRPPEPRPSEVMHAWVAPQPKPVPVPAPAPKPVQASPPPANLAAVVPYGGSLLGMARESGPPAPRPMPVNATQWYNAN